MYYVVSYTLYMYIHAEREFMQSDGHVIGEGATCTYLAYLSSLRCGEVVCGKGES